MSGRRRGNAGKGFSSFLSIIVFGVLIVAFTQIYPRYQRNQQYATDLNTVRADFSSQKWESAIEGYGALWGNYPDKEKADVFNLAAAHENWGTELYTSSLNTRKKWNAASLQFELSAGLRPLSEQSMLALGDCYIEQKAYEKCERLLTEVDRRSNDFEGGGAKFTILKKRLEQVKNGGKTPKKK